MICSRFKSVEPDSAFASVPCERIRLWLAFSPHRATRPSTSPTDTCRGASDRAIWEAALQDGAAIITKDEDFAQLKVLNAAGPTVIWIRLPNTRRQALLTWFARVLPDIVAALERGETLVEVT